MAKFFALFLPVNLLTGRNVGVVSGLGGHGDVAPRLFDAIKTSEKYDVNVMEAQRMVHDGVEKWGWGVPCGGRRGAEALEKCWWKFILCEIERRLGGSADFCYFCKNVSPIGRDTRKNVSLAG